jgi:hypothetical protein
MIRTVLILSIPHMGRCFHWEKNIKLKPQNNTHSELTVSKATELYHYHLLHSLCLAEERAIILLQFWNVSVIFHAAEATCCHYRIHWPGGFMSNVRKIMRNFLLNEQRPCNEVSTRASSCDRIALLGSFIFCYKWCRPCSINLTKTTQCFVH